MDFFAENNLPPTSYHNSVLHRVVIFVVYVPLALILTCANAMVILPILGRRQLRKPNYFILTSLAVNDFLIGCVSVPLEIYVRTVRSQLTCLLSSVEYFYMWSYVFIYGSLTHLLLVSIDRYIAVTKPLRYETILTNRKTAVALTIAWSFTLFYAAARIILHGDDPSINFIYSYCLGERGSSGAVSMAFDLMVLVSILVVGILLVSLNIHILLIAIRQANRIASVQEAMRVPAARRNAQQNQGHIGGYRHVKATKITLSMVTAFLVSFIPLAIFLGAARFITTDSWYVTADDCVFLLFCMSSAINPVIYFSRDSLFRENALHFLRSLESTVRDKMNQLTPARQSAQ